MAGFDPKQLQSLMSQAKKQYEDLQQKMRETVVEASSGGGSVRVRMNGQKQVLSVKIEDEIARSGDVEMQGALGGMMMGGLGGLGL
jgi:DNA-binding protein YbaB